MLSLNMRVLVACLSALVCAAVAPAAHAQPAAADPVNTQYALYRSAIERGDLAAAETAAAAALAASQARDGEGGKTATLAYNLALMRIDGGRAGEAREPAALALRLAEAGADLDPLAARLAFGQAELAAAPERGAEVLRTSLAQVGNREDLDDRVFRAAAALGGWALSVEQYDLARSAWAQAVAHVRGEAPADVLARERARTAQAAAIVAQHAERPMSRARDEAYALLSDAVDALYPYALEQSADGVMTPFQVAYAEAIGWRDFGRAVFTPRHEIERRNLAGAPMCAIRWSGNNALRYTLQMAYRGGVGFAVFRLITDETGRVTQIDVAHAAPEQDFSRSLSPVLARLRAIRSSRATDGCTMPRVHFQPVSFVSGL